MSVKDTMPEFRTHGGKKSSFLSVYNIALELVLKVCS